MPEQRTIIRSVRWTADEWKTIQDRADECQLAPASYVHDVALGHEPKSKTDAKVLHQLARVGNNLNQLTRMKHQGQAVDVGPVLAEVMDVMRSLR